MRARIGGKRLANEPKIAATLPRALGKTRIGRRLPPIPSGGGGAICRSTALEARAAREEIARAGAICRSRAMEGGLQSLFQGPDQKPAHQAGIAKPHFGLG